MSLSAEESSFLRFYFLNLKIASKAVRAYFDSVHPPSGLASELANCSVTLKGLRFITNSQLKILYPSTACNVRSEDFDTTLMICLLRNMTPHECAPITGWDNIPLQGDASTGADLARVKWYRNMLAHHEDGKLSPIDSIHYWTDLESAIFRLGGPSLHQESQSAQHIFLDTSLTDMLNTVRNCEKDILNLQMSYEKHTSMITDLQTTLHTQKLVKEKHETEIQLLQDSIEKGETVDQNLATKLSDTTVSIAKSKEEIEACHKEIETNEVRFKDLQEQLVNEQIQIDKLVTGVDKFEIKNQQHVVISKEHGEQITKYDRKLAKQSEQLAEHDEQIALNAKDIDDIKKKQLNTGDSSSESRRKRLEEDTKALIEEDLREGTFVTTVAAVDGFLLLKQNGVLLITGHAGTGKSRISRHILHMFCTENTSFKCIKLDKLQEWEDMVNRDDDVVVLLDDIFGETNSIYNSEKDIPTLDKVYAYVYKGNIKVIITIRDTVKIQCLKVFHSHRLFQFCSVNLSLDKYKLSQTEKQNILTVYMKAIRQSNLVKCKGFVDHNGFTILRNNEISKITRENPVNGFPLVVFQFVGNDNYFELGSKFFDRPTETILEEIDIIRRKGETNKGFMLQYGVMVYTAIQESGIYPNDNSNVKEVSQIIDAVYEATITVKKKHILDAVKELERRYLVKFPNQTFYRYHHSTLQESVILSFAQIAEKNINKIIPLLSWTFCIKMIKPNTYLEKEGEVVLRIPTNSYELLANRLVKIYMTEFRMSLLGVYDFLVVLNNTEIFQENCDLLTYFLDVMEQADHKDSYTENMIRSDNMDSSLSIMKDKDVVLSSLLIIVAARVNQFQMFQLILQMCNQIIGTNNNCYTTDYLKTALITSLYKISSTKDVSVKAFKALLDILDEMKIPVILDQNIKITKVNLPCKPLSMIDFYEIDTLCVFLHICILNAFRTFNIPLMEFLLARYHETPFDLNVFLKVFYSEGQERELSSVSHKSLKWMIEKFEDKEWIDIDFILRRACEYQMLNTLEYLASRCETFNAISCLKRFLNLEELSISYYLLNQIDLSSYDKEMFSFLFSKIKSTLADLTPLVILVLQKLYVPDSCDHIFDAFLPFCLDSKAILTLACKNGYFHIVKQIMEKGQTVNFQTALLSCFDTQGAILPKYFLKQNENYMIEDKQLKIVKYIVEKFGYEQIDFEAVCHQAYHSKKFKIIGWLVQNIDSTLLNVDFIRNSILEEGKLEILDYTMSRTKLTSFEKIKVLNSIIKQYNTVCSSKILEIASVVWDSTDDKNELKMEEIVWAAYQGNCLDLLLWIYKSCNSYISTDMRKLLMLACDNGRVEVVMWAQQQQGFELQLSEFDGGQLFISACDNMLSFSKVKHDERISMVNCVLKNFDIKPFDLKSGLLRLISLNKNQSYIWDIKITRVSFDRCCDLVVSILEKNVNRLSEDDLVEMMNTFLDQKLYVLANCLLNITFSSFETQNILNKACADAALETIHLLSEHFSILDINHAMLCVCTCLSNESSKQIGACLDLLWKESNNESIDVRRIVSTVCKEKSVRGNVFTWILLNFPHNQIPIIEVIIACCRFRKLFHVKYIFHEIDHELLNINEAFSWACRNTYSITPSTRVIHRGIMSQDIVLVDCLFQMLHDKTYSLSALVDEFVCKRKYDYILYFLKEGYFMNIDMKNLMNEACRLGHCKLVHWILEYVEHSKLDIKSAFHEACKCKNDGMQLQCVALIWHYIQDIHMLEIDTV